MRQLVLLVLVACETPPKSKPADPPPPPPAVEPMAKSVRTPSEQCPVGDHIHTDLYEPFERVIAEAKDPGPEGVREWIAADERHERAGEKPRRAGILEWEISNMLETLCAGTPGCRSVGLFTKSGAAIALSWSDDDTMPVGFDAATWKQLDIADGETVEIGNRRYVVFRAQHGRAICIIDR